MSDKAGQTEGSIKVFALGRTLASVIAAGLFVFAIYQVVQARRESNYFFAAIEEHPLDLRFDLSKEGHYTAAYSQECKYFCGVTQFYVGTEPGDDRLKVARRMEDLDAVLTISDYPQDPLLIKYFKENDDLWDKDIVLAYMKGRANGDHTATIDIEQGTGDAADINRQLYARTIVCGMDYWPVYIMNATAMIAATIGIGLTCYVGPSVMKHGFKRPIS